jgi:xanthine dehydrogenase molybdopterin-binding subunit B
VKFGISFTYTPYNQAGALVLIYRDGTVQVNHGGTEMGQGLHTKILGVAMRELGLPAERIRLMTTATDKVPNTSATAASSGSDLNGAAVRNACVELRVRLAPVAATMLAERFGKPVEAGSVRIENAAVFAAERPHGSAGVHGSRGSRLHAAHRPFSHRLLRHTGHSLGSRGGARPAISLLRVRRCGQRSGG